MTTRRPLEADVAIVGAGVAGLFAATVLPAGLEILVLDKGTPGRSGSSPWAQGGMAAAVGPDDSASRHAADTMRAGDGLVDPRAAHVLGVETPDRVHDLITMGAEFDLAVDGELDLAREGGQTVGRSVHRADATGAEMIRVLREQATPRVRRVPGVAARFATAEDGRVQGVWIVDEAGDLRLVSARAVLLATGGCGALFAATTNQPGATGDGVALAYLAGAAVRDLEFVQFHPTGLAVAGAAGFRFLLTEALRGAGATLHDEDGKRFLVDRHPDAELAPRHVVSQAIMEQEGGQAWLDSTGIGAERLRHEFPTVLEGARSYGYDLSSERVPVTPAAHYMVGGVRTDLRGRTSLPGLYAAGEVASTGVHGANRMAGNSLAEAVVFGHRAAETILDELPPPIAAEALGAEPPDLRDEAPSFDAVGFRDELTHAMWRGTGPVRSEEALEDTAAVLEKLADQLGAPSADRDHLELHLAVTAGRLITRAALHRRESRGGHYRSDFPRANPELVDAHTEWVSPA